MAKYSIFQNRRIQNALNLTGIAMFCCMLVVFQIKSAIQEKTEQLAMKSLLETLEDGNQVGDGDIELLRSELGPLGGKSLEKSSGSGASSNLIIDTSAKSSKAHQTHVKFMDKPSVDVNLAVLKKVDQVPKNYDPRVNYVHGATSDFSVDNVFISVKSTKRFHEDRLKPVLRTWFQLAKDQTWIFTDDDDPELEDMTNGHIINTHCPATHYRQALCCKMSMEFDAFLRTSKPWFCHFDDDNYVNIPALLDTLAQYSPDLDWYLGKPSLKKPIRIPNPVNRSEEASFWFATGGAGFCLSRALATRMSPEASGGKFIKVCDQIQLPDDVTMGYIVGHLLQTNLTVIPTLHSHFETMKFIDMRSASTEVTFSYVRYDNYENLLDIKGFSEEEDPTRFLSLHCLLYPNFSFCANRKR